MRSSAQESAVTYPHYLLGYFAHRYKVTNPMICWGTLPTKLPTSLSAGYFAHKVTYLIISWVLCPQSYLPHYLLGTLPTKLPTSLSAGVLCPQIQSYLPHYLLGNFAHRFKVTYLTICWGTLPTDSKLPTSLSTGVFCPQSYLPHYLLGYFAHRVRVTYLTICWGTLPNNSKLPTSLSAGVLLPTASELPTSLSAGIFCPQIQSYLPHYLLVYLAHRFKAAYPTICWCVLPKDWKLPTSLSAGVLCPEVHCTCSWGPPTAVPCQHTPRLSVHTG